MRLVGSTRAKVLLRGARRLGQRDDPLLELAMELERVVLADDVHPGLRGGAHRRLGGASERDDRRSRDTVLAVAPIASARPTRLSSANSAQTMPAPLRTPDQRLYKRSVLYCQLSNWRVMRFKYPLGSASNSAANSAVGPVSAPRIPLPAASLNCRQQSDLSMIYNLRGRFSGRSEVFLPASREVWSALREELIGE